MAASRGLARAVGLRRLGRLGSGAGDRGGCLSGIILVGVGAALAAGIL